MQKTYREQKTALKKKKKYKSSTEFYNEQKRLKELQQAKRRE